jgi:nucleoside recognition membrane protein YjiH
MAEQVYMDIPAVRDIAKTFDTVSDVLAVVNKALEALAMILKTTAFIGLVGGLAVLHFIETIRPYIQQMAEKCAELCTDLNTSIDAFENGDQEGATRFH